MEQDKILTEEEDFINELRSETEKTVIFENRERQGQSLWDEPAHKQDDGFVTDQ